MLLKANTVSILAKLYLRCDGTVLCTVCPSDEETAILHQSQSTMLEYSEVLLSVMDYCAEMDYIVRGVRQLPYA